MPGPTLAAEDLGGEFQGLFIIAAQLVTPESQPQPCYLDLVLPERIAEHHFVQDSVTLTRGRGRRVRNGTVIPAIGIEKLGNSTLFFAKENPFAGIDVLKSGLPTARHRDYLAYDLAFLLRDQKRYEEAIDAFSIVIEESQPAEISPILHRLYSERLDSQKKRKQTCVNTQFSSRGSTAILPVHVKSELRMTAFVDHSLRESIQTLSPHMR